MLSLGMLLSNPALAAQFEPLTALQTGIGSTAVLTLGPEDPDPGSNKDGCVYAVNGYSGAVSRICFDFTKSVTGVAPYTSSVVIDINGAGGGVAALLGLVFDPASDPNGTMVLYLAYSDNNGAPFNGKIARAVSVDGGLTYTVDEEFVTGLPRMNETHQTNGLRFGPVDGCLYVAQGNNSNAGYDFAFAESRLSGAILRACINSAPLTIDPAFDRNCGAGNSQEACDIEVYASGMRNPFDIVWHSNGNLYASDNDANSTFRQADPPTCNVPANTFGCPCQANPGDPSDELNLVEQDKYYGSPNPYVAMPGGLQCQGGTAGGDACAPEGSACPGGGTCMNLSALCTDPNCGDPLLCLYFGGDNAPPTVGEDPAGIYRPSILPQSSTPGNLLIAGIDEYNGDFCSDWSGDLVATGAPAALNRFRLVSGGTAATYEGSANLNGATGLDVVVGPDGTIYVADFNGGQVTYLEPVVQPSPGLANYFDPNANPQNCPPPPVCGDNVAAGGEECDGTDDLACPGACQLNCMCPPGPTAKVVEFRADQANGAGAYPVPGASSPWVDLVGIHDGTLVNFAGDAASGWQGTGVPSDPYRLEYDGTNDQRVTIPAGSIPDLNPGGSHAVAVWFKTSPSAGTPPANGDREIVVEWVERYAQPYEATSVSYLNGTLQLWDCTGAWINTGAPLSGDTWYHVVLSKVDKGIDGSASETRLYLDGNLVYENLSSTCLEDQNSEVGIGSGVSGGAGNYAREMSGAIAQVSIWDGALDTMQVQAEYAADVALYTVGGPVCGNDVVEGTEQCDGVATGTACDGLCQLDCTCPAAPHSKIVDLRADQADGMVPLMGAASPWVDLTLNSHDGALTGFAGDANSGWLGTGVPSDPYRLEYDGTTGQGVTLAAGSIPELNGAGDHSHTMAAWFKTSSTVGTPPANGDREMIVEWVEDYGPTWRATSVSYLNGMLQFWDCAGWLDIAPLAGDSWYHVLVSKVDKLTDGNASEVRVYLDGAEVWSNLNSTCLGDQVSEIGIGTGKTGGIGTFGRILSGAIGQVSIWDGALDATKAMAEYAAGVALYGCTGADLDGDGVSDCAGDCDDTDPTNFPGNIESCDGNDNDCGCTPASCVAAGGIALLSPDRDGTMYAESGGTANGAGQYLFGGNTANGDPRRALMHFDIAGSLPAGATITDVTLTLNVSRTIDGQARDAGLYRVLADWGEGASDAGGPEGGGTVAQPGDATWTDRFFGAAMPWTTPGSDHYPSASALTSVAPANGPTIWNSTPALVADVQGWYDNPGANFGWVLIGDETTSTTARRFDSRENPNQAVRPVLAVGYTGGRLVPLDEFDGDGDGYVACAGWVDVQGDDPGILGGADNCPADPNPGQTNVDGDAFGDACDCAPQDPTNAPPVAVGSSVRVDKNANDAVIQWQDGGVPGPFRLYQGFRHGNGPFVYDHVCDANPISGTQVSDPSVPLVGRTFYYLVARIGCGESGLGTDSLGTERPGSDSCGTAIVDTDGDGVVDLEDNCPQLGNAGQPDGDGDGFGDVCDNCPVVWNLQQADLDGDGLGDLCDADLDGDGVADGVDNCPWVFNPTQDDNDGDGIGDACDPTP